MNKYINTQIADVDQGNRFTLSANPNYIVFKNKNEDQAIPNSIDIKVQKVSMSTIPNDSNYQDVIKSLTCFTISELNTDSSTNHEFWGTTDKKLLASNVFMVNPDNNVATAENICACFLKNIFLRSNFNITVTPIKTSIGGSLLRSNAITLEAKGTGEHYNFDLKINKGHALIGNTPLRFENSTINDSIGSGNEISIDIYTETKMLPGETNFESLGKPLTTLSKTYIDRQVWFDLNTILNTQKHYAIEFLQSDGWCNAGTLTDLRFTAKRFDGSNHEMFYVSDPRYVVNGYARNLEKNNLEEQESKNEKINYVFDVEVAKGTTLTAEDIDNDRYAFHPLTLQPISTHIAGQTQYFNFILGNRGGIGNQNEKIGILYGLYTQSGTWIEDVPSNEMEIKDFKDIVYTLKLNLDDHLENHARKEQIGIIKVYLFFDDKRIMRPLTFRILPRELHRVNDFAFLNSLGGWSAFNFGGDSQTEFKTKATTIHCTQTPQQSISSELESVYSKEVDEQFMVETAPLQASMIDWLKEISVSPAVFELSTKRYIVVDDLTVKHTTKEELFVLQMKYHYSDSYNASTK